MVLTGLNAEPLEETIQLSKALNASMDSRSVIGNLTTEPEVVIERLVQLVKASFGRLDYVLNCAGIAGKVAPTDELPFSDFRKTEEINVDDYGSANELN